MFAAGLLRRAGKTLNLICHSCPGHSHKDIALIVESEPVFEKYSDEFFLRVDPDDGAKGPIVAKASRRSERKSVHWVTAQAPTQTLVCRPLCSRRLDIDRVILRHRFHRQRRKDSLALEGPRSEEHTSE